MKNTYKKELLHHESKEKKNTYKKEFTKLLHLNIN